MLKNKVFLIALTLLLVAGGGYWVYTAQFKTEADVSAAEPEMQTAVARRGDLVLIASGTGNVTPAASISLGFEESGTLIELDVKVGDLVQAGEVLARLQTKDTQESIDASIAATELAVVKAQNALNDLIANSEIARTEALSQIAAYAQEVRDAQYQIENFTIPTYLQGMDAIEALDLTKQELDAASEAFEPYKFLSQDNSTRYDLLVKLNEAQTRYDAAVKRLNYEYVLQVAQANLAKSRQEYEKYKSGPAKDELELAESELENARTQLALAKESKAVLDLKSPLSGTVMEVTSNVGEVISASPVITISDLEQSVLQVYLDETDMDKVAVGYDAEVVFDAVPDKVYNGKVISLNPSLITVSNVQAIELLVKLDEDSLAPGESLLVGLSAAVDIIAGRAENAILVPVEALRELSPGEYAVFVIEEGKPKLRQVQVGLQDITYAQITSGLQEGEVVSTGIVQSE